MNRLKWFSIGFVTASACFIILLYNTDMPDYLVYDCRYLQHYEDVPQHVKESCDKEPSKLLNLI